MVDLDLRALSAPLEALRGEVAEAYKRIDDRWAEIVEQLKKLPIPCTVGYAFNEDDADPDECDRLEWRKWRGEKVICLCSYRREFDGYSQVGVSESVKLYDEWSAEQRLAMLNHIPAFFDAAAKQVQEFIENTKLGGQP